MLLDRRLLDLIRRLPDNLGATLLNLLQFHPKSQNACEELFQHASSFMVDLDEIPAGIEILKAQVSQVEDVLKPGAPLRQAVEAVDALLERKAQEVRDAVAKSEKPRAEVATGRKKRLISVFTLADELLVFPKIMIAICEAEGIHVAESAVLDSGQANHVRSLVGKWLPRRKQKNGSVSVLLPVI